MNRFTIALVGLATLACVCPAVGGDPATTPVDTYYVIGIDPPLTKVKVSDGHIGDGKFHEATDVQLWGGDAYWGVPEDGFIFVKAEGEPVFALTQALPHRSTAYSGRTMYSPCEAAGPFNLAEGLFNTRGTIAGGAMVFTPPVGKVSYIASVSFAKDGRDKLTATYKNDLEGARAFMKAHHPEFADRLEQGSYQMMPATGACR